MKKIGNFLKLTTLCTAIVFIVGCESFMANLYIPTEQQLKQQPQKVKNLPPKINESSIALAANIYLAKPDNPDIKKNCENLWSHFKKNPDPRNLISLASTIKLDNSHAPCRKYLGSKVGQKINNYFFTKEKNKPDESEKTKKRFKYLFLLLLAHNPESALIENLQHLLKSNPELIDGEFFITATHQQNAILQSLFCSPIGKTLVRNNKESAEFKNTATYVGRCFERESKRAFLLARKKRDSEK